MPVTGCLSLHDALNRKGKAERASWLDQSAPCKMCRWHPAATLSGWTEQNKTKSPTLLPIDRSGPSPGETAQR
jgi:hypothetical protein